ncbi:MAG: hypothetical protein KDA33_16310 [Phycisphaerales bacterium]|nr:hypothetical protein [Phycisphaerales bacterium]
MLKKSMFHCVLCVCAVTCLSGFACDKSGSKDDSSTETTMNDAGSNIDLSKSGKPRTRPMDPTNLPEDAPIEKVILGPWVSEDVATFTWHFAGDGSFVVSSKDESDLSQFPEPMQNKVATFIGNWTIEKSEIVLTNISGNRVTVDEDVRVPFEKINNQKFKINGVNFKRQPIGSAAPSGGNHAEGH